jgi:hypothetical protein
VGSAVFRDFATSGVSGGWWQECTAALAADVVEPSALALIMPNGQERLKLELHAESVMCWSRRCHSLLYAPGPAVWEGAA